MSQAIEKKGGEAPRVTLVLSSGNVRFLEREAKKMKCSVSEAARFHLALRETSIKRAVGK